MPPRRAAPARLAELLRARGYRATLQRQAVFDALTGRPATHLSADAVYARVHRRSPGIDRATVYRTLNFLRDLGLVSQSEMNGQRVFEVIGERPHHHLLCEACGHTTVLDEGALTGLAREVLRRTGFVVVTRHLVLTGLCADCRTA